MPSRSRSRSRSRRSTKRPPAFIVAGREARATRRDPAHGRARRLDTWLSSHRSPSDANVSHWLYQHAWIVTGAKLGWWHGAEALERLIRVDQHVQRFWGIGSRSERVARAALAEVRKKAR